jgi:hypothetical protein
MRMRKAPRSTLCELYQRGSYSRVWETGRGGAPPATLFIECRLASQGSWWIMGTLARLAL